MQICASTHAPLDSAYSDLLARLNAHSVSKHADAFADIDWDHPSHRIALDDPRFALPPDEPLAGTAWYAAQSPEHRARVGLHIAASRMKVGVAFESILSRGLLEFAGTCPRGSLESRYAYHEVIEESQHSLMFQEFVNRAGLDVEGMRPFEAWTARAVPPLGRTFPEAFFLHVLAGESPIDAVQRRTLARGRDAHPLLRRIMQIHVSEEARHVCFATRFLTEHVPRLGAFAAARLRLYTPFIVRGTLSAMMRIPDDVIRACSIPRVAVREACTGPLHAAQIADGVRPVHALCDELGLITPRTSFLWRWLGVAPARRTDVDAA